MTRHIRVRASGGGGAAADGSGGADDPDLASFTPAFLWLLRDFYLRREEEGGRRVTPRASLETALQPVAGAGRAVEAKNGVSERAGRGEGGRGGMRVCAVCCPAPPGRDSCRVPPGPLRPAPPGPPPPPARSARASSACSRTATASHWCAR